MDKMKLLNDNEYATDVNKMNSAMGNISIYPQWNLGLFNLEKNKRILDIGCGPGMYFDAIMAYSPSRYVGVDFSEVLLHELSNKAKLRGQSIELIQADITDSESLKRLCQYEYDYVLCFDVLEHIEDDQKALKTIRMVLLNTGMGELCIRLPALPFIYGENDKAIGHFRRYSKKYLTMTLERCGYKINKIGFQNFLGPFFWFTIGKILKRSAAVNESESTFINSIIPLVSRLEKIVPPPFGLSLFCTCSAIPE
jgi:ubiquinone/menaquinone biosynthesis C-methylase UbiE